MLFVGAIEGIASQRELAWRCADSLSLRRFLGFGPTEPTPDHSTLTLLRRRLPVELHEQAFRMILAAARRHDVLRGRKLAISMPWSATIRTP
jgi:transposase